MAGRPASTDTVHNYTIVLQNRTEGESAACVLKAFEKKGSEEAAKLGVRLPKCQHPG